MTVRVLLFAGLRERLRQSHVDLELAADATVRDLLSALGAAHPTVRELLPACRVAVDQTFVTADHPVHASSEVAVIPPVSGGHGPVADDSFYLGPSPLAPARAVASVERRSAGGVVTFIGKVREHSQGRTIHHLEYEAYEPMALRVIQQLKSHDWVVAPGSEF